MSLLGWIMGFEHRFNEVNIYPKFKEIYMEHKWNPMTFNYDTDLESACLYTILIRWTAHQTQIDILLVVKEI